MPNQPKPPIHGRDHEPGGADPIRFPAAGANLPSFALWGLSPDMNDDDAFIGEEFGTTDEGTFDMSDGLARILAPGFYVIGCQLWVSPSGSFPGENYVSLALIYEAADGGHPGYSIEVPWFVSGGTLLEGGGEQVLGTRFIYPEGVAASSYDVALQRFHPVSFTDAAPLPVKILPTFFSHYDTNVRWVAVWGFRVSGDLGSTFSD